MENNEITQTIIYYFALEDNVERSIGGGVGENLAALRMRFNNVGGGNTFTSHQPKLNKNFVIISQ